MYRLFVDFKQAYDGIDYKNIYIVLPDFNIPSKLVVLMRTTILNSHSMFNVNLKNTNMFHVSQGLTQVDGL